MAADMNRRQALLLGTAAIAVAALPEIALSAPAPIPVPPTPAWVVGTPGEFDWQFVRASSEEAAKRLWAADHVGYDECEGSGAPDCECELCIFIAGAEADRMTKWDDVKGEPAPADWLRAGLGHICARCGDETSADCGKPVGNEAVCEECITLTDWDIIDPERAAEIRADMAEETA